MRAKKNPTEQRGMQRALVLDGAAMCDAFSLLERRVSTFRNDNQIFLFIFLFCFNWKFLNRETVTEVSAAGDIDRSRYSIKSNRGLAFKTIVAFGPHASVPHFETFNETDIVITDQEPCIIDSGGQYIEGTAEVTRTCK